MNSKYWTSRAMTKYGGSFLKALGECLLLADDFNTARLEAAFSDYFKQYSDIGDEMKAEDDKKP